MLLQPTGDFTFHPLILWVHYQYHWFQLCKSHLLSKICQQMILKLNICLSHISPPFLALHWIDPYGFYIHLKFWTSCELEPNLDHLTFEAQNTRYHFPSQNLVALGCWGALFLALLLATRCLFWLLRRSEATIENGKIKFCHLVALRNNTTALTNAAVKHGQAPVITGPSGPGKGRHQEGIWAGRNPRAVLLAVDISRFPAQPAAAGMLLLHPWLCWQMSCTPLTVATLESALLT